jgi:hypothetical protein
MATTNLHPDVSLPDDVLDALADALATMLVLEMENVVVEVGPDGSLKSEQEEQLNQPHSRRRR